MKTKNDKVGDTIKNAKIPEYSIFYNILKDIIQIYNKLTIWI